jgi:DNA-binding response OmpR family regulator
VACAVDRSEPKATLPNVGRLLIIEDDVVVANGIQAMLEAEGLEVRTIGCGADAVDTINEFQPDALVLDIGLPDIDGVELYRQLSRRWPKLPVLFSTGHGDELKLQEYLDQDNVGFLLKPYGGESLLSQLEAIS